MTKFWAVAVSLICVSCGGGSAGPTSPSNQTPSPTPTVPPTVNAVKISSASPAEGSTIEGGPGHTSVVVHVEVASGASSTWVIACLTVSGALNLNACQQQAVTAGTRSDVTLQPGPVCKADGTSSVRQTGGIQSFVSSNPLLIDCSTVSASSSLAWPRNWK